MTQSPDSLPQVGAQGTRPDAIGSPSSASSAARSASSEAASGPAFRALLERLEEHTRTLERQSQSLEDASGLAGAVDSARASLQDAVTLGDRLLEAYREARQQSTSQPQTPQPKDRS